MKTARLRGLALTLAIAVGVFVGVGGFTFHYGEGTSYFSDDPASCINCHIMQPHFDSWVKSSHRHVASCNDCHMPEALVPMLIAKADNGWRHSWHFTFDTFAEPIRITDRNARILQANCERCHGTLVHEMTAGGLHQEELSCVHCHIGVGHGASF